ncbi:hypothetical protein ACP4OV_027471 [Aristida adscensionis]
MEERPGQEPTVAARAEDAAAASEDDSDGEFEFPFVSREPAASAAADELFAGGRIRTFYPVFGRPFDGGDEDAHGAAPEPPRAPLGRLFQLEGARTSSVASTSSSSSAASADAAAGLDGASPDSYCLWTPGSSPASSPARPPRKSGSTGSMARWRRIGELVVGRSHSDGREKFIFLSAPPSPAREHRAPNTKAKAKQPKGNKAAAAAAVTELDTVAAGRRMSYGAKASPGGVAGARRTFLPYRQDLVGLFANMHGLSRSHHHPF